MENMPEFTLHRPDTAEEAAKLKASDDSSRYLAGGTDMIVNVRRGIEAPETMIDLTAIGEITQIAVDGDGLRIGAGVKRRSVRSCRHRCQIPGNRRGGCIRRRADAPVLWHHRRQSVSRYALPVLQPVPVVAGKQQFLPEAQG